MKVSQFTNLLENVAALFDSAAGAAVGKDLRMLRDTLVPFGESSITEFTEFLRRCDEFNRTGVVPTKGGKKAPAPKKAVDGGLVESIVARIRAFLAAGDRGELTTAQIDGFARELNSQPKPILDAVLANMELAKTSKKPDAVKKITQMLANQAEIGVRLRVTS